VHSLDPVGDTLAGKPERVNRYIGCSGGSARSVPDDVSRIVWQDV
jgi:hypothetical protein